MKRVFVFACLCFLFPGFRCGVIPGDSAGHAAEDQKHNDFSCDFEQEREVWFLRRKPL
jgi:hypothetical protein